MFWWPALYVTSLKLYIQYKKLIKAELQQSWTHSCSVLQDAPQFHRIIEYLKLEGTHKDHQVQLSKSLGKKTWPVAYYLRNGMLYNKDLQVNKKQHKFYMCRLTWLYFDFWVLATGFLCFQLIPWEVHPQVTYRGNCSMPCFESYERGNEKLWPLRDKSWPFWKRYENRYWQLQLAFHCHV